MKMLVISALLAATFSGVAGAETVCVEPWQPPSHPPVHPAPCHKPPEGTFGVDSLACPLYASLAPGVPGVVDIAPDGDVWVAGVQVWDCPPYES